MLRKYQPNFKHYAKKIVAQTKKWFSYKNFFFKVTWGLSNATSFNG